MLFSINLSVPILGLAVLASAVPLAQPVPALPERSTQLPERGLVWVSRALQTRKDNNNLDAITITEDVAVKLTELQRGQEVQLTVLVEEKIKIIDQKKKAKDNVRTNHYKNKDNSVNTIIVVVTEIIDIRDSSNKNTRYMTYQLKADNKASEDVIVFVSESKQITIDGSGASKTGAKKVAALASATASAAASMMTVDPSAPFTASNATMILPSGAPAPSGQKVDQDPAIIVEEEQAVFVEFVSSD